MSELSGETIAAAIEVHKTLGPGLLESVYEQCLAHELSVRRIPFVRQQALPIKYKDIKVDAEFRADLIVDNRIIVELKTVENLLPIHRAQALTYLKLTGIKLALLINFNETLLMNGLKRVVLNLPEYK